MAKIDRLDDTGARANATPVSGHIRTPQPRATKQSGERPSDSSVQIAYAPGQIIAGKYQLRHELGTGGMGAVWAAYNVGLDTQVAVKLLRPDLKGAGLDHRFLNEARASARLGHPAIVRVFDFGRTEQRAPFIVMELLEGESLGESLGRHARAPAVRAVQIMLPIADALVAAHAKGIIHRDLKPDNVFLARSGARAIQPKILDFGIAKLAHEEGVSRRTQHGMVMGSPEYMAPEQARGQTEVDYRVDIWSFAVVLYELLWGEPPFIRDNYNATMRAIIEDTPRSLDDVCDEALWGIIERGLRKSPDERWQTMRELGQALARWLLARGVTEDVCHASLEANWLTSSVAPQVDDVFSAPSNNRLEEPFTGTDSGEVVPFSRPQTPATLERPQVTPREAVPVALPDVDAPLRPKRRGRFFVLTLLVVGLAAAGVAAVRSGHVSLSSPVTLPDVAAPAPESPAPSPKPASAPPAAEPPSASAEAAEVAEPVATEAALPTKAVKRPRPRSSAAAAPARRSARPRDLKEPW